MMKVLHLTRHKSTGGVFLIKKHSSFNDVLIWHNKKRKIYEYDHLSQKHYWSNISYFDLT